MSTETKDWTHIDVSAMGFDLERVLRPLAALVERMDGHGGLPATERRHEEADRAEDVARFSAKEIQDFLERHENRGALPTEVETEFHLAVSLIVALNSMASLFPLEDSGIPFPEYDARWTMRVPRQEVVEAMLGLSDHAADLFLRDSVGSRWGAEEVES